jgi:class 3 adenylate cyclase/tetratricopeptide (TPR) repeat protein
MQVCPSCGEENPPRFRLCGFCGAALAAPLPAQEERRTVTIVFSDLKGSTDLGERLDPESLREVMTRYFDAMTAVLRRHGGTIEKYIGDAIMAVFGLPRIHEDDALRAVRAAGETRLALARLNDELERTYGVRLTNRTGVNTGEVVSGDATTGQRLVIGDTVNVAARLEQVAPANEVLIGELTYQLVRGAVQVETVEPLELKGKSERVPAYRLIDVAAATEGVVRRADQPMVGRDAELGAILSRYAEAAAGGACRAVTIIGQAGVGKSRLVREAVDAVRSEARILRGRCLPYGDGITFWPIGEAVRDAAGFAADDPAPARLAKLEQLAADREVAVRVASAIGLAAQPYSVPELFWGIRRLLERLGQDGPLVVVVDDIHWAEPTLLDLLVSLLDEAAAPLLILATARNDLLETQPDWGSGPTEERILLQPLTDADVGEVVRNLLGGSGIDARVQERIVSAAEGNPLFVEQLLSMLVESRMMENIDGRWTARGDLSTLAIPPSLQALLTARLDRLSREERGVIEPASVIGLEFAADPLRALVVEPLRDGLERYLTAIERRELIRHATTSALGGDAYRFGHILIRDAAYQRLLKRSRATLHEQFVTWADATNRELQRATEFEEITAYHLEQAHRYLVELGPLDEHGHALGVRAAALLAASGRRALLRGDAHAAASLLTRARAILAADDPAALALLPELGEALMEQGEFVEAERVVGEGLAAAETAGDARAAASARLTLLMVRFYAGGANWSEDALASVDRALPLFEAASDETGQATAWRLRFAIHGTACQYRAATEAAEQVLLHARRALDPRLLNRGASGYAVSALFGPMPVADAIARCESLLGELGGDRRTESLIRTALAQLYAMRTEIERGRSMYAQARRLLEELGGGVLGASTSIDSARIELLAGEVEAARRELRRDYEQLSAMGERFLLATVGGMLARVEYLLGEHAEAEKLARIVGEVAAPDDIDGQALWRAALATCLARRGEVAEAQRLGAEAVELRRRSDSPALLAEALTDLAEVQRHAGMDDAVRGLRNEALALYERKGDLVSAGRLRTLLA